MSGNCVFCREIKGSRETNFARLYPEALTRFVAQTESFVAFPCIGQLKSGHSLIVPRQHLCTFSDVIFGSERLISELNEITRRLHSVLGENESDSFFFEHGALSPANGGCGIYHAHIHVIPNANSLSPLEVFEFEGTPKHEKLEHALIDLSGAGAYVMAGSPRNGFYAKSLQKPLASQTLRKKVAEQLGVEQWDWRQATREKNMLNVLAEVGQ